MKIVIAKNEQKPWTFPEGIETVAGTLSTADVALFGYENTAAIERKELGDFISCITTGRDRFTRELERLRSFICKAVVIEASMEDIVQHRYRSQTSPEAVIASMASWQQRYGISFILAGNRDNAVRYTIAMFRNFLKQRTEECKALERQGMSVVDVLDEAKRLAQSDGGRAS